MHLLKSSAVQRRHKRIAHPPNPSIQRRPLLVHPLYKTLPRRVHPSIHPSALSSRFHHLSLPWPLPPALHQFALLAHRPQASKFFSRDHTSSACSSSTGMSRMPRAVRQVVAFFL
ncbi:hypothetical protein VPH35_079737 [Triticum aestivum]